MNVIWQEQCETDVPPGDDWLRPWEFERMCGLRFAKRRGDWRLGRWTAKCAIAAYLGLPLNPETLRLFEIRPAPSGAPEVFRASRRVEIAISLSHRTGMAICAAAASPA